MEISILILICSLSLSLAIEEPKYEVLKQLGSNMEIRRYPATKWVSTEVETMAKDVANNMMFGKLFDYISGVNSEKQKIEMTAPVLMEYVNKESKMIEKSSTVSVSMNFYIPSLFKNNTPQPTANDVLIREVPEMIVAVAKFGGYASLDDYLTNRDSLLRTLGPDAQKYDSMNLMTAGYNSPFTLLFRRNEVWLKKLN